jgi:hypothetical protein
MTADSQAGVGERNLYGIVKSRAAGHYSRAGENTFEVTTQYTRIRTPGKTEVITVYN